MTDLANEKDYISSSNLNLVSKNNLSVYIFYHRTVHCSGLSGYFKKLNANNSQIKNRNIIPKLYL